MIVPALDRLGFQVGTKPLMAASAKPHLSIIGITFAISNYTGALRLRGYRLMSCENICSSQHPSSNLYYLESPEFRLVYIRTVNNRKLTRNEFIYYIPSLELTIVLRTQESYLHAVTGDLVGVCDLSLSSIFS